MLIDALSVLCAQLTRDLLAIAKFLFLPHLYLAPRKGDTVGILWKCLMLEKLEWLGYRTVKKTGDMLSRFHLIPERNGQTDGRTDRQICYINIARQYADAR